MKKITTLFLCVIFFILLTFNASAESNDLSAEFAPPRVFIEPDDGCVNVYIDGITDEYISGYSKRYVKDMSSVRMYTVYVCLGNVWKGSSYNFISYIHPYDITSPYRITAEHSLPYKDGEDIEYEETKYELTYYDTNNRILTSGYLFKVYDKDAAENLTQKKYVDTIAIAAYKDEDGKDCIPESWISYFGGPDGGNDERMNITFLEKTDTDISSETEKTSPDTGITDTAAIAGLSVLAIGVFLIAKKRK